MERFEWKVEARDVSGFKSLICNPQQVATTTEKNPIYLSVDAGVDVVAIFSAAMSLVVALLVAWLTLGVQRNQIQANISNFRNQWMAELRGCVAELVKNMAWLINSTATSAEFKASQDWGNGYVRSLQLRSQLELLLSRDDLESKRVRAYCGDLLDSVSKQKFGDARQPLIDKLLLFQDSVRAELESAWKDAKNDLGINRSFFGFHFARTSKS
ncbi:hypothetical protein ALP65_200065 [Pseudomonas aeruginosa]|uniref:Uncharacterized protein n=1 Tax=Pseudomonas aeruginosa TaxID=287 RepID=A0A3M5DNP5_PSEAI|nr:hypothetical protein ALP65_200065 [Pseudomonas aeruginosa]